MAINKNSDTIVLAQYISSLTKYIPLFTWNSATSFAKICYSSIFPSKHFIAYRGAIICRG